MTVDINGVEVHVPHDGEVFVVTSSVGDCVSTFEDSRLFERGLEKGTWDDAFVYKITRAKGLELLNQPMSHGNYAA